MYTNINERFIHNMLLNYIEFEFKYELKSLLFSMVYILGNIANMRVSKDKTTYIY